MNTITLLGAAGEVTGSAYLVQTKQASVLVDFGLFQGRNLASSANQVPRELDPEDLDAVVLTHAHLDHTGRLPLLVRRGYAGPVYATPASLELTQLILQDSAKIQEQDAERDNRKRAEKDKPPLPPLYTVADVAGVVALFKPLPYRQPVKIAPGVSVRMYEAGHILGSTSIEMTLEDSGVRKVVVFSGDIGPRNAPILRDAECLSRADLVFMESTYGDHDHRSLADTVKEFRELVTGAVASKGRILVPTFAVGRAQQIMYHLSGMFEDKVVDPFPVILDSPMAIEATRIHQAHPELFDDEMKERSARGEFRKNMAHVRHSVTADESRALNDLPGPCLIMAGAGMCNAGRILHHLRHSLSREGNVVLIVGYQSPGSLGRLLIEGATTVTMFGERIPVRAVTHSLGGFSAHAGQTDLMEWLSCLAPKRPRLVLTHGEDRGRIPLAELIEKRFGIKARLPEMGEVVEV